MSHVAKRTSGFTIIELSLAMSFVALLLLAVAMTTIRISNIYTRGITLKEVNQVGREVTGYIQRDVNSSAPFDLAGVTTRYVSNAEGGRLCVGQFSYVWNTGMALENNALRGQRSTYDGDLNRPVHLARVTDPSATMCARNPSTSRYPTVPSAQAIELLTSGDRMLVMHGMNVVSTASATDRVTNQQMYTITMTIGTNTLAELRTNNTQCAPPGGPRTAGQEAGSEYCAVNTFNIVARAGNKAVNNGN